jgi:hypothetical protein
VNTLPKRNENHRELSIKGKNRDMRRPIAILGLSGVVALAIAFFSHSRTRSLPSAQAPEATPTSLAEEHPVPTPPPDSAAAKAKPTETRPTTNLLVRLYRGEELPPLTREQVEA